MKYENFNENGKTAFEMIFLLLPSSKLKRIEKEDQRKILEIFKC